MPKNLPVVKESMEGAETRDHVNVRVSDAAERAYADLLRAIMSNSKNGNGKSAEHPPLSSSEKGSVDTAQMAQRAIETTEREIQRVLGIVQMECKRLIEDAARRAQEILLTAEEDAARIIQAAMEEGERINAEAEKKVAQARMAAEQAEEAFRVIESAYRALTAMDAVLSQAGSREVESHQAVSLQPPSNVVGHVEPEACNDSQRADESAPIAVGIEQPKPVEPPKVLASPQITIDHRTASVITLVVSPFGSFRSLTAFQNALQGLDGVRDAKIRRFHKGVLYEFVQYDGIIPLEERLKELVLFKPQIIASGDGKIELRIDPGDERVLQASTPE